MRRRQFILLTGAVGALPFAARAQLAMPVVGFIDSRSASALTERLGGFRQGLKETGFVEGDNVTITYRWAENQLDRIPALLNELVHRPVAVIVASGGTPVATRIKATVSALPVVFISAEDPVKLGLVQSLAKPGGNFTGINFFSAELVAKRLELLRVVVPLATRIGVLVNPLNVSTMGSILREVELVANGMGLQLQVFKEAKIVSRILGSGGWKSLDLSRLRRLDMRRREGRALPNCHDAFFAAGLSMTEAGFDRTRTSGLVARSRG